jgi:PIN domain nuclease of toxin-antitoxin system
MKILLDTCEFLWFISGDPALPANTKQEAEDPENEVLLSVVSFWEIMIKYGLGKLPLPASPDIYISAQREPHGIQSLALDELAVKRLVALPPIHRGPIRPHAHLPSPRA